MFRIVLLIISVYLLLFEILLYVRWRKRLGHRKWYKYVTWLYWPFVLLTQIPLWMFAIFGRSAMHFEISDPFLSVYYFYLSWQYTLAVFFPVYLALLVGGATLGFIFIFGKKLLKKHPGDFTHTTALSRRDFFRKAAAGVLDSAPAIMTAGAFTGMFLGSREITTDKLSLKIKGLHSDLAGLRVVQLSDIHIGSLINEQYLHFCFDLIKPLKPDLVLVTGDIIDNNNYFLKTAGEFFHKVGGAKKTQMYGILGNHDFIDNGDVAGRTLNSAGLRILRNESLVYQRGRGRINLAGLDYPNPLRQKRSVRAKTTLTYLNQAKQQINPRYPTILMNHHPEEFSELKKEPIDLVLAGHTHGGQFRLSSDRDSKLSFGSIAYKYYVGHYEEGNSQLYVNRGLGHWFPLRINCPPEITFFELLPA